MYGYTRHWVISYLLANTYFTIRKGRYCYATYENMKKKKNNGPGNINMYIPQTIVMYKGGIRRGRKLGMCLRELFTYTSGLDDSVRYNYTMLVHPSTVKW